MSVRDTPLSFRDPSGPTRPPKGQQLPNIDKNSQSRTLEQHPDDCRAAATRARRLLMEVTTPRLKRYLGDVIAEYELRSTEGELDYLAITTAGPRYHKGARQRRLPSAFR